jgi:hypothetical protein
MVYEFIAERRQAEPTRIRVVPAGHKTAAEGRTLDDTTGSIGAATPAIMLPRPRPQLLQDTLTATDRLPGWREPVLRQEAQVRRAG